MGEKINLLLIIENLLVKQETLTPLIEVLNSGEEAGEIKYKIIDKKGLLKIIDEKFYGIIDTTNKLEDIIMEKYFHIPFYNYSHDKDTEFDEFYLFIEKVEEYYGSCNEKCEEIQNVTLDKSSDIEISEEEISNINFKHFIISFNNKQVKLKPENFITLSKMCTIIDKLGYKVEEVILE